MAEVKTVKINIETNAKKVATDMKSINDATKEATDSVEGLGEASEEAGGKTKVFNDIVNVVRKMVPGFKAAEGGVNSFGSSLKALMMNPIVLLITAIVGALTALFKAFTSTKAGGEQLEQFMSGLGAIMDVIRDRILAAGEAIVKFFSGDLKGALDSAKKAISGFGDEVSSEFKKAANATKQLQVANDEFRKLSVSRAKLNRDLAKTKEIITDENASLEEKRQAIEKVRIAEERQTKAELENAAKKLKAIKAKNALSDTSREDLDKEAQAEAELYRLQEESARNIRTFNKQERLLRKQEQAEQKEQQKERLDKLKEEQKLREEAIAKIREAEKEYNDTFLTDQQKEINAVEAKYKDLIALAKKHKQDTTALEEARANALNDINVKFAKIEEETNEKLLQQRRDKYKKEEDLRRQQIAEEEAYYEQYTNATLTAQQIEVQAVTDKYFILIEQAKKYGLDTAILEEKQRKELAAINKKYDDEEEARRQQLQQQKIDAVKNTLSTISNLASLFAGSSEKEQKKAFEIQKAANIAQATIDTYTSAVSAFNSLAGVPIVGPALGIAAAAAAVTAGLMNIKKIASTKFESAGGGGGGVSAATPSAGGEAGSSGVMSPNFNIVGNAQATNPLAGLGNQPIQAYVVSGEVTTAQSLDRNRINYATFG